MTYCTGKRRAVRLNAAGDGDGFEALRQRGAALPGRAHAALDGVIAIQRADGDVHDVAE
jgi:hypothetical protein